MANDKPENDEMRPEYDLRGGVRGKYYERAKKGSNVVLLEPDIAEVFTDRMADQHGALELVERFHGALILLQKFDLENVRNRVATEKNHPPREFAIVATYLRTLAHVGSLIRLNDPSHFQALSMIARAIFELAVDIRLIDRIEEAPDRYAAFSKVERLRVARRIVDFHAAASAQGKPSQGEVEPMQPESAHEQFINENAAEIEALTQKFWPKNFASKKPVFHWSNRDLRQRAILLGDPFHEIYDVEYAELSWYVHPGVGVIATLDKEIYPVICGKAYGIAVRCYAQTLRFMIGELRLGDLDNLIEKKLEFARLAAFCADQQQASALRRELLGF
jgi:hypothetical protein